jgi:hypothetical protein
MSCNKTKLGFDIDSQYVACVNFYTNPVDYYLSCNIEDNPNLIINCSAFTNSGCTTLLGQSGYLAFGDKFRPYSLSTPNPALYQVDFCITSIFIKKCCGDEDTIFKASNLSSILGFAPPIGMVLDLEVTDENFNIFRQCFEVINVDPDNTEPVLSVNNVYGKYGYGDCDSCKENNPNCYLNDGDFTFVNCKSGSEIVLTIDEANTIKVGDVVSFSGECYSATTISPTKPTSGSTGPVLVGGCNNSFCKPTPPITIQSEYVSGCCDNLIYKLVSGNKYNLGLTLSVNPSNFCYRVIQTPSPQTKVINLNDLGGVIITSGCDDIECQSCSSAPNPIPPGSTATGCEIITILEMGIKCNVINPVGNNLGVLSVDVSGGTQPYSFTWTTPSGDKVNQKTLIGQPEGTYKIEVVDKYGDFIKTTFCSLVEIVTCDFEASINQIKHLSCNQGTGINGYVFKIN